MNYDFIYHAPKAFSPEFCQNLINIGDNLQSYTAIATPKPSVQRNDFQFNVPATTELAPYYGDVMQVITQQVNAYANGYDILAGMSLITSTWKFQITPPGGGFHQFHIEQGSGVETSRRVLAWMAYLNDVQEGGETEFLYQKKRFKPSTGDVLIWPAGFTHPHRGNPPLSGNKYIITGWFSTPSEFLEEPKAYHGGF